MELYNLEGEDSRLGENKPPLKWSMAGTACLEQSVNVGSVASSRGGGKSGIWRFLKTKSRILDYKPAADNRESSQFGE